MSILPPTKMVIHFAVSVYVADKNRAEAKVLSWIDDNIKQNCPDSVIAQFKLVPVPTDHAEVRKLYKQIKVGQQSKEIQAIAAEITLSHLRESRATPDYNWLLQILRDSARQGMRRLYLFPEGI